MKLLFDLFPDANNDRDALVASMRVYYTVRGVQPTVTWDGNDILLQVDEAKSWFHKALVIEPKYANPHHGLTLVAQRNGDLRSAFFSATHSHQPLGL